MRVPFHRSHATGRELGYLAEAIGRGSLAGDGAFTRRCQAWLERDTGASRALLTHSCTGALEMCALLLAVGPGDEVIMPSFTFVSTASAFALRGATPVFVDVRPDTLNLDERRVEAAITPRTKAICAVHYAGVGCEMDEILAIAARHGLAVVEDAAQGCVASYRGRRLGSLGALGALSFHDTKHLAAGEGGALLVNDARLEARAEVLWQKGTNRQAFSRGEVDRYSWIDLGSSFLAGELGAAFLCAQLEAAATITAARQALWSRYHEALAPLEARGVLRRPIVPAHCAHNAHAYHVLLPSSAARASAIAALAARGIEAVFHYVPLHDSPAGARLGRCGGGMEVTRDVAGRVMRLPMWLGVPEGTADEVAGVLGGA